MNDDLPPFPRLAGAALILFAIIAPLAYCESQISRNNTILKLQRSNESLALKQSCIEAKGRWVEPALLTPGPGSCVFPSKP